MDDDSLILDFFPFIQEQGEHFVFHNALLF
jgi:hypothetical protein